MKGTCQQREVMSGLTQRLRVANARRENMTNNRTAPAWNRCAQCKAIYDGCWLSWTWINEQGPYCDRCVDAGVVIRCEPQPTQESEE